jgi:hypothetical protein
MSPLLQLGEQLFEAQLNWATQNPRNYLVDQPRCDVGVAALSTLHGSLSTHIFPVTRGACVL